MTKVDKPIVFMGTPDFGVPALKALHGAGYPISLVLTQPDRPKGRGRKTVPSPIKKAAEDLGLSVFQPASLKNAEAVERISAAAPAYIVVIAFGQILPKSILAIPRCGAVNVHASLLPKYRGAAPIQWAIVNRETETGVTTMLMDEGLDTGDILLAARTKIEENDTAGSLHDRLAAMGADLIVQTLRGLASGTISPVAQDPEIASYAPMLKKEDGRIDWQKSPEELEAFVRGMDPWPGAFTTLDGKRLRIFRLAPARRTEEQAPGTVIQGFPDELRVAAGSRAVSILEVQGESGKRLDIADFLRGKTVTAGTVLG
ncbi:MAG: methionyl-tRNA formyltransferase [Desulfobacterales bacterium]|nr:methionyl-tRNA formyltransferase [Desulfobacterales bacterium]